MLGEVAKKELMNMSWEYRVNKLIGTMWFNVMINTWVLRFKLVSI